MNINDLELAALFGSENKTASPIVGLGQEFVGKYVLIRTYSAGVWAGILQQKSGNEVILIGARRLWFWHAAKSISLSGVAIYGINQSKSKIAPPVEFQWLEAIEITPMTPEAQRSIVEAAHAQAQ